MHAWITLPILLGFAAFYLALSIYILYRLVNAVALARAESSGRQLTGGRNPL